MLFKTEDYVGVSKTRYLGGEESRSRRATSDVTTRWYTFEKSQAGGYIHEVR